MEVGEVKERADFDSIVCGIPCGVVVDDFYFSPPFSGSPQLCESDVDYYGECYMSFHLVDRKGYKAEWLEDKMDKLDVMQIETEIMENYRNENYNN